MLVSVLGVVWVSLFELSSSSCLVLVLFQLTRWMSLWSFEICWSFLDLILYILMDLSCENDPKNSLQGSEKTPFTKFV